MSFEYHSRGMPPHRVLDGITLQLSMGEIVAVVGSSGCGKSTLLAILSGLLAPSMGTVEVQGEVVNGSPGKVGFMMQRDELFPWRSVLENVLLGPQILKGRITRETRERALQLIELAGLQGFEKHYPGALSEGMKQRVAFLRTLMLDRPMVLLDEPFGALDAITRTDMQEWLLRIWEEMRLTLLLVTHDVEEAIFLADRVLVMMGRPSRIGLEREVPFDRPRAYESVVADPRCGELKRALLHAIRSGRRHTSIALEEQRT